MPSNRKIGTSEKLVWKKYDTVLYFGCGRKFYLTLFVSVLGKQNVEMAVGKRAETTLNKPWP